jgi:hypothetical protein
VQYAWPGIADRHCPIAAIVAAGRNHSAERGGGSQGPCVAGNRDRGRNNIVGLVGWNEAHAQRIRANGQIGGGSMVVFEY